MPQLKKPATLEAMCIKIATTSLRGVCESWVEGLLEAAQTGNERYTYWTEIVVSQCDEVRQVLSAVTKPVLDQFIPLLARNFVNMMTDYDQEFREMQHGFWNEGTHNTVSTIILRTVLSSTTEFYHTESITSSFAQYLVIQTLDSVPGLNIFCLDTETPMDHSALLARNIRHIEQLRVFQYSYHCTDEVIEQLRLHCPQLRKINFSNSQRVTNASVQHLLQLRELQSLSFKHTQISDENYGLLLSELPKITDIRFWKPEIEVLNHITVETLATISHVRGYVKDIDMLTQKCPNITHLEVYNIPGDLSSLTVLTSLHSLEIAKGHYGLSNLNAVLTGIGHRLTSLTLILIVNVNLQEIVTLCPRLQTLDLRNCRFLPLKADIPVHPQLPHFRSVITLNIDKSSGDEIAYTYLRYYMSLKTIILCGINIFTVDAMRDTLRRGTFTYLEEFYIEETGHGALTIEAVDLLIEHCSYLKKLGYLGSCPLLNPDLISQLKSRILLRNLDLEIFE